MKKQLAQAILAEDQGNGGARVARSAREQSPGPFIGTMSAAMPNPAHSLP
jgi:hypothetical protein